MTVNNYFRHHWAVEIYYAILKITFVPQVMEYAVTTNKVLEPYF